MHVLELGSSLALAFAGMILVEQGMRVHKWVSGGGDGLHPDLSDWFDAGKQIEVKDVRDVLAYRFWQSKVPDLIIDTYGPDQLQAWGIDPKPIARKLNLVWVSLDGVDAVTNIYDNPLLIGDHGATLAGLWLAYKALALYCAMKDGYYTLDFGKCLTKMSEHEILGAKTRTKI